MILKVVTDADEAAHLPEIFVAGDGTGRCLPVHAAVAQGACAACNAREGSMGHRFQGRSRFVPSSPPSSASPSL